MSLRSGRGPSGGSGARIPPRGGGLLRLATRYGTLVIVASLAPATVVSVPAVSGSAAVSGPKLFVRAARDLPASGVPLRPVVVPPTVGVGNGPDGIVVDPTTHTLYTDNEHDDSVSVVNDAACNAGQKSGCAERTHTVALAKGANPQGIALDAATGTLYVSDVGNNTISVINATTCNATDYSGCGQVPATVKDPYYPNTLGVDALTDTIYVANCGSGCDGGSGVGDTVSVIDGATCNAENTSGCGATPALVVVGEIPDALAVDPSTDTIYVAEVLGTAFPSPPGGVSVIDGATCNATVHSGCNQRPPIITVGGGPNWVALDPANHSAYTANNTNNGDAYSTVSVIDTATCNSVEHSGCDQKTATVPVGTQPWALTVDPVLHTVYVANDDDDTLSVIDTSACEAADTSGCSHRPPTIQVGKGPQALTVDPTTGTLYVANTVDNTVSVIDASSCDGSDPSGCRHEPPVATVGADPSALAVDTANSSVYVANEAAGTVSVVDAATCNVIRHTGCKRPVATVRVGNAPSGVAIDQATGTAYVTNLGDGTVSVIDAISCNAEQTSGCSAASPTVKVGKYPLGIDVDQATETVYVTTLGANEQGDTVSVIDGSTCNSYDHAGCAQIPTTVKVGTAPFDLAVNQVTDTVYVANTGPLGGSGPAGHTVSVIDGATCNGTQHTGCGKTLATVQVGNFPFGVVVDQASNTIYVADNNGGDGPATLSVINGATCDATDTSSCGKTPPALPVSGRAPRGIAFDTSNGMVYTANHEDATATVIDAGNPTAAQIPANFAVGGGPVAVAVDPAKHTVYVADTLDDTLSLLPG